MIILALVQRFLDTACLAVPERTCQALLTPACSGAGRRHLPLDPPPHVAYPRGKHVDRSLAILHRGLPYWRALDPVQTYNLHAAGPAYTLVGISFHQGCRLFTYAGVFGSLSIWARESKAEGAWW